MSTSKGSIVVTGTNGGLGSAIVTQIVGSSELAPNYEALYAVRKAATAFKLHTALQAAPPSHKHQIVEVDLSSLASTRRLAEDINSKVASGEIRPIRALILNAAYQDHTELNMTQDGFETTWQVNYLSNLVLALMLLQSMDKEHGRILIVGSWSHDITDPRNSPGGPNPYKGDWSQLFPGGEELASGKWSAPDKENPHWHSGYRRYGASKLCAIMLSTELGYRLAKDPELSKVVSVSVDPGAMSSDLIRRGSAGLRTAVKIIVPIMAFVADRISSNSSVRSTTKSARDVLNACFKREIPAGKPLYLDATKEIQPGEVARDEAKRDALWAYGIQASGLQEKDTILTEWR